MVSMASAVQKWREDGGVLMWPIWPQWPHRLCTCDGDGVHQSSVRCAGSRGFSGEKREKKGVGGEKTEQNVRGAREKKKERKKNSG